MKSAPSILEQFKEREREIKADADKLDKEMSVKQRGYEKAQADALEKLKRERAALDGMKTDYLKIEGELEGKAEAELRDCEMTEKKVKEGTVSLNAFMRAGLGEAELKEKAQAITDEKLAGARRLILEKQLEVFRLEVAEAEARQNVMFCQTYPGMTQVQKLKAEVQTLERSISEIYAGYSRAGFDLEQAKARVALSEDKSISGFVWNELTFDELKDLRFDPRIVPKYEAELEGFIDGADPDVRFNVFLRVSSFGNTPGLNVIEVPK
jgi:uncharacterized protein (UPF0335 family)